MTALDVDYEACCERLTAALEIKPTYFEAPITWGQQAFERGKLYHQLSKQVDASEKSHAEKISDEMFALAITKYQDAMGMLPPAERDAVLTEKSEESNGVKAQILILWGNVLYEKWPSEAALVLWTPGKMTQTQRSLSSMKRVAPKGISYVLS